VMSQGKEDPGDCQGGWERVPTARLSHAGERPGKNDGDFGEASNGGEHAAGRVEKGKSGVISPRAWRTSTNQKHFANLSEGLAGVGRAGCVQPVKVHSAGKSACVPFPGDISRGFDPVA
jgi:hypothetical protein